MIDPAKEFVLENEKVLTLRSAEMQDASAFVEYLKKTSNESLFLLRYPDEVNLTVEDEERFIQNGIEDPKSLNLAGFLDGVHVGNCSFRPIGSFRRYRHRCDIGIALYAKYSGMGIGRIMLTELLTKAKEAGYEQAELTVVSTNIHALNLYRSLGFEKYGMIPNSMKYDDGTYADELLMVKNLKG